MANPEFSFLYNVTIRQYKNESLFNDLESDEVDVLVLANGLREATDKAEDYAEAVNQNGPYKFYDVVAVEELDTVYTGNDYDPEQDLSAYDCADTWVEPEEKGYPKEKLDKLNDSCYEAWAEGTNLVGQATAAAADTNFKEPVSYKVFMVNSETGEKFFTGTVTPENGFGGCTYIPETGNTATGFGGLSCS